MPSETPGGRLVLVKAHRPHGLRPT